MKSITLAAVLFASLPSLPAAMVISQVGGHYTFTFDPVQTAPLPGGFASYDSILGGAFSLLYWGPGTDVYGGGGLPVIANTLIDNTGTPIPDHVVYGGIYNETTFEVLGFGNDSSTSFSVAGGALTLDFSFAATAHNHVMPFSNYSLNGGSYDPGTTGVNGNLIVAAIPEPSTYIAGAGFLALMGFVVCRRRKAKATTAEAAE